MYRFKFTAALTGLMIFCLINWKCTKIDTTDIGSDLIPAVDNVNTFAIEIPVNAFNVDSLLNFPLTRSECAVIDRTDENVLGYIGNDRYFGKTIASIFFQVLPPSTTFSFPVASDSLSLDSADLFLSYKRTYGDSVTQQKFIVQQVSANDSSFRPDSLYTSCNTFSALLPVLGIRTFAPQDLKGSRNLLRFRLTDQPAGFSFAQELLKQVPATGFKNDSAFKAFFRGFAISPDVTFGGNALTYINVADTGTKLVLYYRAKKRLVAGAWDTIVTNFNLANTGATANKIVRDRTGAEINSHTTNPASEPDSVIYIQATPGNHALLQIPQLRTLGNRIIHRAELIIEQVYSPLPADQFLTPPNFLFLDVKDTGSNRFKGVPCDFNTAAGSPNITGFGGFRTAAFDKSGNPITKYTFNLSRYTQAAVTKGQLNYTFRLSAPYNILLSGYPSGYIDECNQFVSPYNFGLNQVGFGRVKLGGGNNSNYKMRVRIIYSNI